MGGSLGGRAVYDKPRSRILLTSFSPSAGESQVRSQVAWPTIPAMVRDTADRFGDAEAVVDGTRRADFAKLSSMVTGAARALLAPGVRRGDRGRVWAPNSLEWIVAARRDDGGRGARPRQHPVPWPRSGLRPCARGLRPVHRARVPGHRLPGAAHRRRRVAADAGAHHPPVGDPDATTVGWDEFIAAGGPVRDADVDERSESIGPDDPSDVVFTSGTTGSRRVW